MSNESYNNDNFKWSEILKSSYRGAQPKDIDIICHKLCKEYLGGVWSEISADKIVIRRITGGLSNQLYYCGIPNIKPINDEPTEVAIRIYGKKFLPTVKDGENERFNDTIIGVLLSEKSLSPKIYGLFENGEILKYYKNHQFQLEQQKDPELVKQVAQNLAKFHSLKVPIKKNNNLIFDNLYNWYAKAHEMFPISQLLDECKCETLKKVNIIEEIEWMQSVVKTANSPIVFTHLDFRGSNILVIDKDVHCSEPLSRILFCDYEYSDYYNRGIDLCTIFLEFGRPLDEWSNNKQFFEPSMMTPFLNAYVEESAKIFGDNYLNDKNNSIEHIIYETHVFTLFGQLLSAITFMCLNVEEGDVSVFSDKNKMMIQSEIFINNYLDLKDKFISEKFYSK